MKKITGITIFLTLVLLTSILLNFANNNISPYNKIYNKSNINNINTLSSHSIIINSGNYSSYFTDDGNISYNDQFKLLSDKFSIYMNYSSVAYFGGATYYTGSWNGIDTNPNDYVATFLGGYGIQAGYIMYYHYYTNNRRYTPFPWSNFDYSNGNTRFSAYVQQSGQGIASQGAYYSMYNYELHTWTAIEHYGPCWSFDYNNINQYHHYNKKIYGSYIQTRYDDDQYDVSFRFQGLGAAAVGDWYAALWVHAITRPQISWSAYRTSGIITSIADINLSSNNFPKKITSINLTNLVVPRIAIGSTYYFTNYQLEYKRYYCGSWTDWEQITSGQLLNTYAEKIKLRIKLFTDQYYCLTPTFDSVKISYEDVSCVPPNLSNPQRNPIEVRSDDEPLVSINVQSYCPVVEAYVNYTIDNWNTNYKLNLTDGCVVDNGTYSVNLPNFTSGTNVKYYFNVTVEDWEHTRCSSNTTIFNYTVRSSPILSNGMVTPPESNFTYTNFVFSVIYTDEDNDAPDTIWVVINNTRYDMVKSNISDTNYTNGCEYNYTTNLSKGNYEYYFFANSTNPIQYNYTTETYLGPIVNRISPKLKGASVTPPNGYPGITIFTYKVTYYDANNDSASSVYLYLDDLDDSSPIRMQKENINDNNTVDGIIYSYTFGTLDWAEHRYRFYANSTDPLESGVWSPSTGYYSGPKVNTPPQLSDETLSPSRGLTGVEYTWTVTYKDCDGNAPDVIYIYINGLQKTMTHNPADNDWVGGVTFTYSQIITEPGNYTFYFKASDGIDWVRLPPVTGEFHGPEVTAQPAPSIIFNTATITIVIIILVTAVVSGVILFYILKSGTSKSTVIEVRLKY